MVIRTITNFFSTPWTNKSSLFQNLSILEKILRSQIFHVRHDTVSCNLFRSRIKANEPTDKNETRNRPTRAYPTLLFRYLWYRTSGNPFDEFPE